jgi:hypothetical protein
VSLQERLDAPLQLVILAAFSMKDDLVLDWIKSS